MSILEPQEMFIYSPSDLLARRFSVFYNMKLRGDLCDVMIKVEDQSFTAHRIILASTIPYFRTMFTSGMLEATNKEICLENQHPKAVESLINYAYGNKIEISKHDVLSLLVTSDFMEVEEVLDACQEFLAKGLHLDNVVSVVTTAECINQQYLIDRSLLFIRNHFEQLSKLDYLLDLPYECFKKIVGSHILNAASEESVFEAVIKWVKASPFERNVLLPELLNEVRMPQLTMKFLLNRVETETLMSSIPCRKIVEDIKNYHSSKEKGSQLSSLKSVPRKFLKDSTLYIVSKNDSGCRVHLYCPYLADKKMWHDVGSASGVSDCDILYVAVVDQKIYVFSNKITQIFHLGTEEWEVLKTAEPWIVGAAIVHHSNNIYSIGSSKSAFRRVVHRFDNRHNKWGYYGSMTRARDYSAAASMGEFIYVTGGMSSESVDSAEKYNPSTGRWYQIAPMPVLASHHASTSVNGKIYVFGCAESDYWLGRKRRGLVYDPKTDKWNFIAPINVITAYRFSVVPSCNNIFGLGTVTKCMCTSGCTACKKVFELHHYDVKKDKWNSRLVLKTGSNDSHDVPILAVI